MDERTLIDQLWPALEPPPAFSGRVLSAIEGAAHRTSPGRRSRAALLAGLVATAAVAGVAVAVIAHRATRPRQVARASAGDLQAVTRESIDIAGRGVAVAEPGAELGWSATAGKVRVEQRRGAVFYRVEHGTDFVVATGAADVRVTGTCFQIEAAEDGVAVRVLEGSVSVSNRAGALALGAGEGARIEPGRAPTRRDPRGETADLTARVRRERDRVERLEQALAEARANLEAAAPSGPPTGEHKRIGFSPEERRAMAARCEFRYARSQHLIGHAPPDLGHRFGLNDRERAAVVQIMEDQRTRFIEDLRAIYIEIVGDRMVASRLSPIALVDEINAKARPGEDEDARQRLYAEWSGKVQPPADLAARPAVERFWRLVSGAGDDFIQRLTPVVGQARAHEIARGTVHDSVFIGGPCGRYKTSH